MKKIIIIAIQLLSLMAIEAQMIESASDGKITGKLYISPTGTTPDLGYNGNLMITKPATTGQYINLVRSGNIAWSIGTAYNTNNFAIGTGRSLDSDFTNPYFVINSSGQVGIGSPTPDGKLEVKSHPGKILNLRTYNSLMTESAYIQLQDRAYVGYDGVFTGLKFATSDSSKPIIFSNNFLTEGAGELMRITGDGKVGIGTSSIPSAYKLAVAGKIIAEEVVIKLQSNWPDYVFKPDYQLKPISEVESFVKENHHLPGIPNAATVENEGVGMGELQRRLLLKIEELTLYIIQQNNRITELEKKLSK